MGPFDLAGVVRFGAQVANVLRPRDIVFLEGGLGAGKTTLARSMLISLGVDPTHISSPTFDLVHDHVVAPASDGPLFRVLHVDLYRLNHASQVAELGIDEAIHEAACAVVEWGLKWVGPMRWEGLVITLQPVEEETRQIMLSAQGPAGEALAARLRARFISGRT